MTHRLFEEKHHASLYQRYRFIPPDAVKELVLQYLDKKKGQPHMLAVDLGCGTGQNTRLLAPHFQQVVGIDISECQLEEARAVPGLPNITYRSVWEMLAGYRQPVQPVWFLLKPLPCAHGGCYGNGLNERSTRPGNHIALTVMQSPWKNSPVGAAEELPFADGSVDLLTAASAAHWFHPERFLKEAGRILRPRGCMALLGYTDNLGIHYSSCGDRLSRIYTEVRGLRKAGSGPASRILHGLFKPLIGCGVMRDAQFGAALMREFLSPYTSSQVAVANSRLQELFDSIPFPDKERYLRIPVFPCSSHLGGLQENTGQVNSANTGLHRFLEEMGASSPDTVMEVQLKYFCVLACKPH
ncbi:hypothetical protein JZ751_029029 [Albula glossodonta]|uniref:Methyltransferase type 11 domain-containing protein n=1 Tax=Albula glossodonta TaxID=121402 RepID=A0A8T2PGE0_9TELE|nr:hypothetical protein JZ751_029029 [Albula glossodonta]